MNKPGYKPKLGMCHCGNKATCKSAGMPTCDKCRAIEKRMYQPGHVRTTSGVRKQVDFECAT